MGDIGARLLAKALQINNKLRYISLDRNNVTLQGMWGRWHVFSICLQIVILRAHDIFLPQSFSKEKSFKVMKKSFIFFYYY